MSIASYRGIQISSLNGDDGCTLNKNTPEGIFFSVCPHGDSNTIPSMGTPVANKTKNTPRSVSLVCAPTGIRTPVVALKGLRPSPLDDGGKHFPKRADFITAPAVGQAF
jgi:hypothetical protein